MWIQCEISMVTDSLVIHISRMTLAYILLLFKLPKLPWPHSVLLLHFLLLLETLFSTSLTPMSCLKVNTWFRCNQWTKWTRISTCRIQVYVHPLNLTHITSTYLLKIPYLLAPSAYLSVDYHKYNWVQLLKPSISTFAKLSIMCIAYV